MVIYAVAVLKEKAVIRATLAPVWIILNMVMLAQDLYFGQITSQVFKLSLYCVIPVLLAIGIGKYLHNKMNQEFFVKLTYILLIVSGITLVL